MSRTKRVLILLGILAVLAILIGDAFSGGCSQDGLWSSSDTQTQVDVAKDEGAATGGEEAAGEAAGSGEEGAEGAVSRTEGDAAIAELFEAKAKSTMVKGSGQVLRLLSDDNDGSRHQRFIIELASGHTLLIAHNIDLARRVEPLEVGDTVSFYGEYEYSEEGGTIHWTHKDPQMVHVAGYIEANGKRFQ